VPGKENNKKKYIFRRYLLTKVKIDQKNRGESKRPAPREKPHTAKGEKCCRSHRRKNTRLESGEGAKVAKERERILEGGEKKKRGGALMQRTESTKRFHVENKLGCGVDETNLKKRTRRTGKAWGGKKSARGKTFASCKRRGGQRGLCILL